jgi:hypothetical protein
MPVKVLPCGNPKVKVKVVLIRNLLFKFLQFYALWQWLPLRYQIGQPTPLFTSEEHGNSLVTFFQQTGANEPTILLVKTRNDDIFGAFCSHSWENRFNGVRNISI